MDYIFLPVVEFYRRIEVISEPVLVLKNCRCHSGILLRFPDDREYVQTYVLETSGVRWPVDA